MATEQTLSDHESRIGRLEEAFQQVALAIKQLTDLATATDGRLDSVEEATVHTDSRLDALIDSQIQLTQRVDTLTAAQIKTEEQIALTNSRFDRVADILEQLAKAITNGKVE